MLRLSPDKGRSGISVLLLMLLLLTLGSNSAGAVWLAPERLTDNLHPSITSANNAWCVALDSSGA